MRNDTYLRPIFRNPDSLIRLPEVLQRTGLSQATIRRKIGRGEFPTSVRIGANSVAWREAELARWLAAPMEWATAA